MTISYTWELTSFKKTSTSDLDDVIVQTYWKKIGTNEDGVSGEFSGATPFDLSTVDPDNFVSYENLTQEIILGWIQSVVVGSYEEHVNEKIAKAIADKVNPVVEVTTNFPWNPEPVGVATTGPVGVATTS